MSKKLTDVALRHALRFAKAGHRIALYTNGPHIVMVIDAKEVGDQIKAGAVQRTVTSAGEARDIIAKFDATWNAWPHLRNPVAVLDAAIEYHQAARRVAARRMGRRAA
jgi:hypothetical protein